MHSGGYKHFIEAGRLADLTPMQNTYPRAMTTAERDVLDRMLSVDFPGVETLRRSAEEAVVVGGCSCGCPTIYFRRDDPAERMVLVTEGLLPQDQEQAVLLFTNDQGEIAALELMWMTATPPIHFPPADDLQVTPK